MKEKLFMHNLRICIGSNDNQNIAQTHMGDTEAFLIYDLTKEGESPFIDQRSNVAKDLDHTQTSKMKQILELVKDADILIAQQKSPNFIKIAQQTKYQPVIVKAVTITAILELLLRHHGELAALVERRNKGEFLATIPEFEQ
jgi:predicted Fe-Mo cluster-binding NifX family protein